MPAAVEAPSGYQRPVETTLTVNNSLVMAGPAVSLWTSERPGDNTLTHGTDSGHGSESDDSDPAALVEDALLGELFFHHEMNTEQVEGCITFFWLVAHLPSPFLHCL